MGYEKNSKGILCDTSSPRLLLINSHYLTERKNNHLIEKNRSLEHIIIQRV